MIAGYYRIAADPSQLSRQLALTGGVAGAEDVVRGVNLLQVECASCAA
jgi:subfamily B ATP-binding cassette protein HlyB/CyaB